MRRLARNLGLVLGGMAIGVLVGISSTNKFNGTIVANIYAAIGTLLYVGSWLTWMDDA